MGWASQVETVNSDDCVSTGVNFIIVDFMDGYM